MTRYIDVKDVQKLVRSVGAEAFMTQLSDYIRADYLRWNDFEKSARVANHSDIGVIELMPTSDHTQYAFKYVNGHPKNTHINMLTVMAFGALADVRTGYPRLLSELTIITALRTAATSALVARSLARSNSKSMAIIGNGAQSEFQILAFKALLGIREVRAYDIDPAATQKLIRNVEGIPGLRIIPMKSVLEAVKGADIVTTVTADKTNATILTPGHAHQCGGRRLSRENGIACGHPENRTRHCRVRATNAYRRRHPADAGGFCGYRTVAGFERPDSGPPKRARGDRVRLGWLCTGRLFGSSLRQ
jgi:ornithine cyclodeaminase